MTYRIEMSEKASKSLKNTPKNEQTKIINKIDSFKESSRPDGCKKLKGSLDLYRIRSGNYRIIYEIEDDVLRVLILTIGHRKNIYK